MKAKDLALSGVFLAILIICSWIAIPVGLVPVTLSIFAVFLIGAVLSPINALIVTSVYLLLGVVGLPVFSNFTAGVAKILGPTGGYIISYPIMAVIVSVAVNYGNKLIFYIIGMLLALAICYGLGVSFMVINLNISLKEAALSGVAPFILPDIGKMALATVLGYKLNKILTRQTRAHYE